jgi:tetratricopeptide (TPR) repeat protein
MNLRIGILIVLAVIAGACGRDADTPSQQELGLSWFETLDDARTAAAETGDDILLSFEASWCPWSKLMRESVYVSQAVIESLGTTRCVAVDPGADSTLRRELGIVVYPTVVLTDAYGGELGRMIGYHSPRRFLERLGTVRRSRENLTEMFRREETLSEDAEFLMSFGRMLLEMGLYDGALLRFDRATRVDQDSSFADMEEAEYSTAECYMLSGKYKEAGRRFRIFADQYTSSERRETAQVLAGLSYQRAGYTRVATGIYEDYLDTFEDGGFAPFVRAILDSLNGGKEGAS